MVLEREWPIVMAARFWLAEEQRAERDSLINQEMCNYSGSFFDQRV